MTIRLATVGTSSIVQRFARAAAEVPEIALTTAYSRDAGRAAEFAATLGAPHSSADYDALMRSDDIDAVYIASPNLAHYEQAVTAIEGGKHVLVEKSATPTAAEWENLVAFAAHAGVTVMEEMRPANDPGTTAIIEALPELGVLRRARLGYTQRSARYDKVLTGERVNIFDPAMAGGSLYDLGVYAVSQLVTIFGEPDDVLPAEVEISTGADGLGVFLALYPGMIADVSYSKITRTDTTDEIQGELGSMTIDAIDDPRRLVITGIDGRTRTIDIEKSADNMSYAIRRFADLVEGRDDPAADHARTLGTLRVMDAIRVDRRRV